MTKLTSVYTKLLIFSLLLLFISPCPAFSNEITDEQLNSYCALIQSNLTGDLLVDVSAYDACLKLKRNVNASVLDDMVNRYKIKTASEVHKVASKNEFAAKELIGSPYGMVTIQIKRVSAISGENAAILEIYNGDKNPYVFSRVIVPFEFNYPGLEYWDEKAKNAKKNISKMNDGDIIDVICKSDNFRAIGSLSEDYGLCLYFASAK
ncbi:hypothetical protein [Serratia sp. D1N4]